MKIKFYIIKEDENGVQSKHYIDPELEELKDAKNAAKWGLKKGLISLVKPIRTVTTYWEI